MNISKVKTDQTYFELSVYTLGWENLVEGYYFMNIIVNLNAMVNHCILKTVLKNARFGDTK